MDEADESSLPQPHLPSSPIIAGKYPTKEEMRRIFKRKKDQPHKNLYDESESSLSSSSGGELSSSTSESIALLLSN